MTLSVQLEQVLTAEAMEHRRYAAVLDDAHRFLQVRSSIFLWGLCWLLIASSDNKQKNASTRSVVARGHSPYNTLDRCIK